MRKIIIFTVALVLCIFLFFSLSCTAEEEAPLGLLLSGKTNRPVRVVLSSPEYLLLAQFGQERLESLNRMLKYFSVEVVLDGNDSETVFSVDNSPFLTVKDNTDGNSGIKTYSLDHNREYEIYEEADGQEDSFSAFLDTWFFRANRFLDKLYPLFDKASESFRDYSSSSGANISFSGFGRGVRRVIIQFPSEYVKDNFPASLCDLSEDNELSEFINSIFFQGSQKIILLYDKDEHLIRVNYDGVLGLSSENLRKVSLVWKCLRNSDHIKDSLTLKTPDARGNNRDNIIYDRDYSMTEQDNQLLSWDIQMDQKRDQSKKRIRYNADLDYSSDRLTGMLTYNEKKEDIDMYINFKPSFIKEKDEEYIGTLEITHKTGKIVTSSILSHLSFHYCAGINTNQDDTVLNTEEHKKESTELSALEEMQYDLIRTLIQRLITLPAEDLDFINKDIPQDDWNSLLNSLL